MNNTVNRRFAATAGMVFFVLLLASVWLHRSADAASIVPVSQYAKGKNPDISYSKNKIVFYGVEIKEVKEFVKGYYNKKEIITQETGIPMFGEADNLNEAVVVSDYPQRGMTTLWMPIFTGGGTCCTVDYFVTKSDTGLSVTIFDFMSSGAIDKKDIETGRPIPQGMSASRLDMAKVDPDFFGWCTADTPRPDILIIFKNGRWVAAKPGELALEYKKRLVTQLDEAMANPPTKEKTELYSRAVFVAYYSIMAGHDDQETFKFVSLVTPNLDQSARMRLIKEIRKEMLSNPDSAITNIPLSGRSSSAVTEREGMGDAGGQRPQVAAPVRTPAAPSSFKIGSIDTEAVARQSRAGKKARERLAGQRNSPDRDARILAEVKPLVEAIMAETDAYAKENDFDVVLSVSALAEFAKTGRLRLEAFSYANSKTVEAFLSMANTGGYAQVKRLGVEDVTSAVLARMDSR